MGTGLARREPGPSPYLAVLVGCAIAGAVVTIYYPALSTYFFEDDFQWLVTRWSFKPSHLLDLSGRSHFYRPVIELYFWIASPLFRGSPVAFHAAGIALHLANGWLLYLVGLRLGMTRPWAAVTTALFLVQPSYVAAIAWVGALAEALVMLFGSASLYALLRHRQSAGAAWLVASVALFAVALLSHESAIVLLPLIVLADLTVARRRWNWGDLVRTYWPFAGLALAYLAVDLSINARHYLIAEQQYTFGWHIVDHVFQYIASLYVGERTLFWHTVVALVLAAVLVWGTPLARFGVVWMILNILPFAPFDTANVSRYAYVPAAGLAIVLAEGLAALDRWFGRRSIAFGRIVVSVLVLFAAVRFGNFAHEGVNDVKNRAEMYRRYLADLRTARPQIPDGTVISIDAEMDKVMAVRFVEAAVQWEYKNPTLRVVVRKD